MIEQTRREELDDEASEDSLLIDFFVAVSSLCNDQETRLFLSDLLSSGEVARLARRLRIAILLTSGCTYFEIAEALGAGQTTIANVHRWLEHQGEGYAMVIERLKEMGLVDNEQYESVRFTNDSRTEGPRNSKSSRLQAQYFWPAELIHSLNKSVEDGKRKNNEKK